MSIEYPLILPTTPGLRSAEFHARQISGMTASPFTGQQQVYEWPGEWWEADCSLPPMARAAAEEWLATELALRGGAGTFLLGDRGGKTPRGSGAGYPSVDGSSQLGKTLATLGWNPSASGVLKKGDYLQIVKNYLPNPRAFENASWGKIQCTVTGVNTVTAPNGAVEAEEITATAGYTVFHVYQNATSLVPQYKGQTYSFSVWAKVPSGTLTNFKIRIYDGAGEGSTTVTLTTAWQRIVVSYTLPLSASQITAYISRTGTTDGIIIHLWGGALYAASIDARLHKNLTEASSDANAKASLDLWPRLREAPPDFSALILTDAKGTFRLREAPGWTLDEMLHYGISFKAMEAF